MASQEDKIVEELVKTGFPTEIVCAAVMQGRGWYVMHNPSYFDADEGKSREFDVRAYRQMARSIPAPAPTQFTAGVYLVTECKKSDKPWVFFTTPEDYQYPRLGRVLKWTCGTKKSVFTNRSSAESIVSDGSLMGLHHYFQSPRLARTFHQPFRSDKEQSKMIYSAVMSVVKATLFLGREPLNNCLSIYNPLVVFSGDLYEAQVQPNKEIRLLQSKHLRLSFNYITPSAQLGLLEYEFIIDIIHEDYLDEFLKIVEKEHEEISSIFFGALGP